MVRQDAGRPAGNLPIQPTSFIGRERDIAEVERLLASTRLLTLTGAGGVGKTRLALQVAERVLDRFADGVWLVELAPLADAALLPQTLATALGVREQVDRPILDTLIDALKTRNLLLVLDNCEHLVDGCARLADTLVRACSNLRMLVTSREPLNIPGEVAWLVPSLSLPPGGKFASTGVGSRIPERGELEAVEELRRYDAVRLFIERAQAILPSFAITPENAEPVAEVCEQLDGIPLALELAAARMRALSVEQIAARLQDRFRLLTAGGRMAVPRHQTLRALVDWSHDLLSEPEKLLLRRLSVFAAGWTLEAAESICADDGLERDDVLDLLSQLVDKSLVLAEQHGGEKRYRLLETVRQYVLEKLQESGEEPSVRQRHLAWFRELAERVEPGLWGPGQAAGHSRLETELGNLRAALEWSKTAPAAIEDGLRLSASLMRFWYFRGHAAEGQSWLSDLLALAPLDGDTLDASRSLKAARAAALTTAGFLAVRQRQTSACRTLCEQALVLWRELDDKPRVAYMLGELGQLAASQEGELDRAEVLLLESLALARDLRDGALICKAVYGLGQRATAGHDNNRAEEWFEQMLVLARGQGDPRRVALSLLCLGRLALKQDAIATARARLRQSLIASQQAGVMVGFAPAFLLLGCLAAAESRPARALRMAGAADRAYYATGAVENLYTECLAEGEYWLDPARAALGERAAAAWAEGEAMTPEQAIAYALSEGETAFDVGPPTTSVSSPLTSREHEVAMLVADGLTNRQIAAELVISEATAKHHVENILGKLGFASRAQVAAWVAEQGSTSVPAV